MLKKLITSICIICMITSICLCGYANTTEDNTDIEQETVYSQIMGLDNLDDIYNFILSYDEGELSQLTFEQLDEIAEYVFELNQIEDYEYYEELMDTLQYLAGEYEIEAVNRLADWAGQTSGTYTIPSNGYTITKEIKITGTLTLQGSGKISRGSSYNGKLFNVADGATLVITGTTGTIIIDGGSRNDCGTAIYCNENLTLKNVTIQNNYVLGSNGTNGGAIFLTGANSANTMTIEDSIIKNCRAVDASGIYLQGAGYATVNIRRTIIEDCQAIDKGIAGSYGGCIRTNGGGRWKATLEDCILRRNKSFTFGGCIYWNANGEGSLLTISDCHILDNSAGSRGGGLFLEGNNIIIKASSGTKTGALTGSSKVPSGGIIGTLVQGNSAGEAGGGLCFKCYSNTSGIIVDNTVISFESNVVFNDNSAPNGAGIAFTLDNTSNYANGANFEFNINGAEITNNTATNRGAGIYVIKSREDYTYAVNFNSGLIDSNTAKNGGAINITAIESLLTGGDFYMTGGTLSNNIATENGGAVYIDKGDYTVSGGIVEGNTAVNGGSVYVTGGSCTITEGEIIDNTASNLGGAIYVASGNFAMSGGSISNNESNIGGGAIYIDGGNIEIEYGELTNNESSKGGAIYLDGDIDTYLTLISGKLNSNEAYDDGGGIYATNGNLYIGIEDCKDDNILHVSGRTHPEIKDNTAADCGGGIYIANQGAVHFYCGNAVNNVALYKGVGMNVFMDGGSFYLYDGANIGIPRDPDLVIIGGELYNECKDVKYISLYYYNSNKNTENEFKGLAEYGEYINLPDGEYFWDAPDGYRFFGWTPFSEESNLGGTYVRDKDDYKPSGTPIIIDDTEENGEPQGTFDGTEDEIVHLYALWAPEVSNITYIDGLTYEKIDSYTNNTYSIDEKDYNLYIEADNALENNEGYKLVGWYLYQDINKDANWGIEPAYKKSKTTDFTAFDYSNMYYIPLNSENETLELEVESMTFGDITLISDYEIEYTDMCVSKLGMNTDLDNQMSFRYNVTASKEDLSIFNRYNSIKNEKMLSILDSVQDINIEIAIVENGEVQIKGLPIGRYSILEDSNWSWRYAEQPIKAMNLNESNKETAFSSKRHKIKWLDWSVNRRFN